MVEIRYYKKVKESVVELQNHRKRRKDSNPKVQIQNHQTLEESFNNPLSRKPVYNTNVVDFFKCVMPKQQVHHTYVLLLLLRKPSDPLLAFSLPQQPPWFNIQYRETLLYFCLLVPGIEGNPQLVLNCFFAKLMILPQLIRAGGKRGCCHRIETDQNRIKVSHWLRY